LFHARAIDEEIRRHGRRSPLHGIPVLLKDNIDAVGFPTTACSLSLKDNYPAQDAEIVRRLKEAGALILGKANLSIRQEYHA
jgi:amidase